VPDARGVLGRDLRRQKDKGGKPHCGAQGGDQTNRRQPEKDKKNGVFHFDDGSKKERRREDYKSLIGNHLISACAAGDLFSAFNNVAVTMETVRQMTENVENGGRRRTG
jgi:hypothetical protein